MRKVKTLKTTRDYSTPRILTGEDLDGLKKTIRQLVENCAYRHYEARGRQDGRALEDWLRGEAEVLQPAQAKIEESGETLTITMDAKNLNASALQIAIEPQRALICLGKQENSAGQSFNLESVRVIDFPHRVDSTKAGVDFKRGKFYLKLPRAISAR
jgi:HSP20 family molecular chaperone IbpA